MIDLAISDARQWTFCPRVIWHRRVMPHRVRETPKMALGREAQDALEKLEKRRGARRYGLEGAARRFDVAVASARLGVRGVCDLVLDVDGGAAGRRCHPVEVKRTEGGASPHHEVQLAGYAIALEEQEGHAPGSIERGFLVLVPSGEVRAVAIGAKVREAFERVIGEIREALEGERFPPPTRHLGFCPQCEYVHFCGDVL
jgi:CRISPR-associated exonuclease Cas4